jgi:hypothetical protein
VATFIQLIRKLCLASEAERQAAFEREPRLEKLLTTYLQQYPGILDEIKGYEHWLKKAGPHSFTGDFSWFHKDMWDWYWPITDMQSSGKPLNLEDLTYLAIWGRGLGKSTNAEWLAITEGCMVGKGFVLYVCGTAEQSEAHVEAIRERLESESELLKMYPGMRKPAGKGGFVGEHKQYGWRQDYLMTANKWAIRPVGLDKAIRGWKRGDSRVSMIILDDIDDDDDSPEVISKKERRISKKILPMGTARTKVVFAQNLIHSNSVLNRIHTRQTDILTLRKGDQPIKAFDELEIESVQTDQGPRWVITKGKPTWPFIDMAECQSFLDRSGRDAFLAEYQHDFSGEQDDRVLPEYDDRVLRLHVITWSQYEAMYGHRRIPSDWPCDAGLDIGYTTGHKSAWTFLTKAPEWAELTGSIFRYRGRTFTGVGIDEQAVAVRRDMWPGENIQREFMSHEKLGERMVLNSKHGWHFHPCESAKTAGIPQWRHYLVCDRTQAHPFHRDERMPDGLWKLGRPSWFDIVDDDQLIAPRDDRGLKTHRDQAYHWKMRKVEETKSGMTVEQPMKANEDSCFVAGTLIQTARGEIPIEKIFAGEMIWTRKGLRKCLRAWQTADDAPLVSVRFGRHGLTCTPSHKIWTEEAGFVRADAIRLCYTGRVWQKPKPLRLKNILTLVILTLRTGVTAFISAGEARPLTTLLSNIFTLRFGKQLMGAFRKAIMSIMSIMIPWTIAWRTLVAFQQAITTDTTFNLYPIQERRNYCGTLRKREKLLPHGIEVKRESVGIENTEKMRWQNENLLQSFAVSVAQKFRLSSLFSDFALQGVSSDFLMDGVTVLSNVIVKNAEKPLALELNHAVSIAPTCVEVEQMKERAPVYNITVEGEHEYFANGLLVKNCDSTRALTAGTAFGPSDKPMNEAQKIQKAIPTGYHKSELAKRTDISPNQAEIASMMAEYLAKKSLGLNKRKLYDAFGQPI